MPTEKEFEKEAKSLGWSVDYLKAHYEKEKRLEKLFEQMGEELR